MRKHKFRSHKPLFAAPRLAKKSQNRIVWRVLPIVWLALKRTSMLIGAMVLVSVTLSVFITFNLLRDTVPRLPEKAYLFLEFEGGVRETTQGGPLQTAFSLGRPTLRQYIDAIDFAADDPRIHGIVARLKTGSFNLAHVQELRAALGRFRESGKPARIYATSYGPTTGGLSGFYLASAFNERWMQPMGNVSIGGIGAQIPYFSAALKQLGVQPEFFKREEYKTAYESMTHETMSPENREMTERLIKRMSAALRSEIAQDLGITEDVFQSLVDLGLFDAQEAYERDLVTHLQYGDELVSLVKEELSGDPGSSVNPFVGVSQYLAVAERERSQRRMMRTDAGAVALVHINGAIIDEDPSTQMPGFLNGNMVSAEEIAPAIFEAADMDGVEVIVLRVNSPGGSPTASESILRATQKAKEKGKNVVVSMGPAAASGGYWVATHADRIFANDLTMTGSIGVVGGKFSLQGFWKKWGVNWESINWGENAGLWSFHEPFTESQAQRFNLMLDHVYDGFIARVAEGRSMTKQQVAAVAGGLVWTGAEAVEVGLADEIGGLDIALDYAAQLSGADSRHDLEIVELPRPKTALEQFVEILNQQATISKYQAWFMQHFGSVFAQIYDTYLRVMSPQQYTAYVDIDLALGE